MIHRNGKPDRSSFGTARRGLTLVYVTVMLTVLMGVSILAVDVGRVQLAKTQAQIAADAAARYGASGLQNVILGQSAAQSNAYSIAAQNLIDGKAVASSDCTIEMGYWDSVNNIFTPLVTTVGANSVRVTVSHCFGNGNTPLTFAPIFGSRNTTIKASAIATVNGTTESFFAPASGNIWLSGLPTGTVTQNFQPTETWVWDTAGSSGQSPAVVTSGTLISPGKSINFDGVQGSASYDGSAAQGADGHNETIVCHGGANGVGMQYASTADNGIANLTSPIGAMIAVFMDDSDPRSTAAPASLDFSSATSRDYQSLSPKLKQPFFIGDGRRADGSTQQVVVPTGATRVFIGMMDAWQWNDNTGGFSVNGHVTTALSTVK